MERYPKRAETAAWRVIDKEAVIVSPMDAGATILNEVGAWIWKLMDGSREIGQIAEELSKEFEVSEEAARRDIDELIEDLSGKKLITISNSSSKD